ncbi:MAG: GGDEF domain-containing protein [Gammaproteobacteria bacterium]|nr:GGDEF domain-containing protein [Gammaproteobacteria bacterium]
MHLAKHLFLEMSLNKAEQINRISTLLGFGFILSIFVIIFLLVGTDREHKKLIALHRKLEASAATDRLTQLPNRFAFEASQKTPAGHAALVMLNIDGFKHINDFYGTAGGDEILTQLSKQLKTLLHTRPDSRLFRFGADDFGVLITTPETPESPLKLAQNLVYAVERNSFDIHGHEVQISIRAGLASEPPLLERANMALQQTKKQRNKVLRYNASLGIEEKVATNQRITRLLKNAVRRNAVKPFFQPLYNNVSKRIEHYECLKRVVMLRMQNGTSKSPFCPRLLRRLFPFAAAALRPGHYVNPSQARIRLRTPTSNGSTAFRMPTLHPLWRKARRVCCERPTPTADYQPSFHSPWLAADAHPG